VRVLPKTASCELHVRYIPRLSARTVGSKSKGKEVISIKTVEILNMK
jgi:hypothetical protein